MEKAFEKQIGAIEDQGEKQIKAIQNQGRIKTIKKHTYDHEDTPLTSKQKEMFNELADGRLKKITELDEKINCDNIIYKYKGKTAKAEFDKFDNAFSLLDKIRDGKISLTDVKERSRRFWKRSRRSKKRKPLNNARKEVIKFFDDYFSMVSEAKIKATKGTGLKIITLKQMLQRLSIALAQV